MISSMTGYAAVNREVAGASLSVELKSVNSRYLDLVFRLPEDLRSLEPVLRERIGARVQRGKLECRVGLSPAPGAAPRLVINEPLLAALAQAERTVRTFLPDAAPLSVNDVLHWPAVLAEDPAGAEALKDGALALFDIALQEYVASRRREGEKLAAMILERVAKARALVEAIQPQLPGILAAYQEKVTQRLREVLGTPDEDRVRQEIALFGIKVDVAEEMTRLAMHLDEVERVLKAGGAAGKRLDFLMQELHREANTLGAKSVSRELSDTSLELRLLVEQMREQVQNIE